MSICIAIAKAILPLAFISAGIFINNKSAGSIPVIGVSIFFIINKIIFKDSI